MTDARPLPSPSRRRPTTTSAFGVGRREGHDASGFYGRFTPPVISDDDTVAAPAGLDTLWVGDARQMDAYGDVADNSVALVVTSPPYFAGKEYETALGIGHVPADFAEYLGMLHDVFAQCFAKLEPGGRIAINVANLGRKPYRSLARDVIDILEGLGYLLRGEIIWQKSHAAGGSCAWGTYQRPGNPVLRDVTERIIVASKGRFDRARTAEERSDVGLPHQGTMTMDEFVDATVDLWGIPAESATRVGHPAPFPVELPRRLIELYTYRGDLVLDPFMGSGSTAIAALRTGRHYVGFDTDPTYVALAEDRIAGERARDEGEVRAGLAGVPITVGPGRTPRNQDAPSQATLERELAAGQKAAEVAEMALAVRGFTDIERNVSLPDLGISISFRARDTSGKPWLFDLHGAYSATRPGLRRSDVLLRALGRAAIVHGARLARPERDDLGPVVLLTTDLPAPRSAQAKSLQALVAPDGDGPVRAVIELLEPSSMALLSDLAAGRAPLS